MPTISSADQVSGRQRKHIYEAQAPSFPPPPPAAQHAPKLQSLDKLLRDETVYARTYRPTTSSSLDADRTVPGAIMASLPLKRKIALKKFLKNKGCLPWLQNAPGAVERATLIATSTGLDDKTVKRILYCPGSRYKCFTARLCPKCTLDQYIEPALAEYGHCFDRAPYWWSVVISSKVSGAALHFRGRVLLQPVAGCPHGTPLSTSEEELVEVETLVRALFRLPGVLLRRGIITGGFLHLEPHVNFRPGADGCITNEFYPHLHALFCSDKPITPAVAQKIYLIWDRILKRAGIKAHPNVWIDQVRSQTGGRHSLNGWLGYSLKSWPIGNWYQVALEQGCRRAQLSKIFDEVVFLNLHQLFKSTTSTRKIGILRCTSKNYIGDLVPRMPTKHERELWGLECCVPGGAPGVGTFYRALALENRPAHGPAHAAATEVRRGPGLTTAIRTTC